MQNQNTPTVSLTFQYEPNIAWKYDAYDLHWHQSQYDGRFVQKK